MALTRKMLKAMELDDDKIAQILEAHTAVIDEIASERDTFKADAERYKAQAEKLTTVEKDLVKAQAKIEEAEENAEKLKNLRTEFEQYKADVKAKAQAEVTEKAYRSLLKEAGIADKYFDKIIKVTDLSKIKLDKDNKIEDSGSIVEGIKSEWSDFVVTQGTQGANVVTPPTNTGGNSFDAMSLAEKMAYANDNPNSSEVKAWLGKKGE